MHNFGNSTWYSVFSFNIASMVSLWIFSRLLFIQSCEWYIYCKPPFSASACFQLSWIVKCLKFTETEGGSGNSLIVTGGINSLRPSDTIWRHRSGSGNGLLPDGTKPLPVNYTVKCHYNACHHHANASLTRSVLGSQTAPPCPHDHPRVAQHMG